MSGLRVSPSAWQFSGNPTYQEVASDRRFGNTLRNRSAAEWWGE